MPEPQSIDLPSGLGPALIYCRVSTKSLAKGTSLDSQESACVAHANHLGYAVARVTREAHTGADLLDRPLLSHDRADIRTGRFRALIVYSVDRLTRSEAHLSILSDECSRAGCRLIFVAGDEFSVEDEALAADVERRRLRERAARSRRATLLQGRPVFTGFSLYGYRPDREAGVHRVYEPEAAVVRRAFSMCASGRGMYSIASTFNREGIPSPKSAFVPGARWSTGGVSAMLNNRSYAGEEYCLKTRRDRLGRDLPLPDSEWLRMPDGVRPAIITRELWEECQEKIRERAARMNNRRHPFPALLRGHIFCAECGSKMVRNYFKRGKYEYLKYRCGSRSRPFPTDCRGEGVPLELAHHWAWEKVKEVLADSDRLGQLLEGCTPAPELLEDLQSAQRAHQRVTEALRALGISTPTEDSALGQHAGRASAQLLREQGQLETMIADLEARIALASEPSEQLLRLTARGYLDSLSFEERRDALRALGFRVHANGEETSRWACVTNASAGQPGGRG